MNAKNLHTLEYVTYEDEHGRHWLLISKGALILCGIATFIAGIIIGFAILALGLSWSL